MKGNILSFFKVAFSNIIVMVLGIVSTLIIPIVLGPEEFGFWQLYLLYSSYVGLFIFGYNDGVYLIYGGRDYKDLNYNKFSSFFYILAIYLLFLSLIGIIIVTLFFEGDRQLILLAVCLTIFLQCLNSFFVLINQATSRFNIYSVVNIGEKLIFIMLIIICLLISNIDFEFVIIASLVSKLVVLLINILADYKLVFTKPVLNLYIFRDIGSHMKVGIFLTISGIFSMLITGVGRFLVDGQLGIVQFGYYSFAFSVLAIVTQVIVAASIVLFPMLRNSSKEILLEISLLFEKCLDYIGVLINFIYYIIYFVIINYLPNYSTSLKVILFIFPILIFQSKINIIYNTAFKVLRLEKKILYNGLLTLVFGVIITYSMFYVWPSIVTISLSTLITYCFWSYMSNFTLSKYYKKKLSIRGVDILSTIIFIFCNINFPIFYSFLTYLVFVMLLIIYKNKDIKNTIFSLKKLYSS